MNNEKTQEIMEHVSEAYNTMVFTNYVFLDDVWYTVKFQNHYGWEGTVEERTVTIFENSNVLDTFKIQI